MHFVFYGKDKKGALQVRVDNRPAHVDWLKTNPIVLAGPLLDDQGEMCGSMVVCEVDDQASAEALFDTDPYGKAGLFDTVEIKPWKWVIGAPE